MKAFDFVSNWNKKALIHPTGFIYIDFPQENKSSLCRLHIWPEKKISAPGCTHPIHNHVFNLESHVLKGAITNNIYIFIPSLEDVHYQKHTVQKMGVESILYPTNEYGNVVLKSEKIYQPTNSYFMKAGIFHEPISHGLAVTIVKMSFVENEMDTSTILVPKGKSVKPDNEFKRDSFSELFIWNCIEQALDGLDAGSLSFIFKY